MEVRESKPLFMQEVEILASNTVDEKKPIYISKEMRRRAATAKRQKKEKGGTPSLDDIIRRRDTWVGRR